jgi:DNA primase
MAIPDSTIEEVRARGDLVELVSEHTRLRRSGRTFRGPCPLHGGEGPNFSVDPARNLFKCFVCGEGGDVFAFPMKHLGMSFLDAVRFVAERVGVEIPDPREEQRAVHPHQPLLDAVGWAADWFRRQLWDEAGGEAARAYLERRGVAREAAERFGLGWAPEAWAALRDAARTHGISDERLLEVGLVKKSSGDAHLYDAFRGRLIFPIEDLGGRPIAFGGRIVGEAEEHTPKYLNSPESPVYHKGRTLYGLGWSRNAIRKAEAALVVEGYMDYVSLAAHGVRNVVAPLGTTVTPEQAELLARYTGHAVLLYDSDRAGLKATFRTGDELLRAGVEVGVATLPEGEDPDSVVRRGGAAALQPYLADAVDVLERKIQILERRDFFGSISGTRRAVDALLPTVRASSDELLRGVYLRRISERTGVPQAALEREVAQAPARDTRPATAPERRQRGEGRRADDFRGGTVPATMGPERDLLLLLLQDESWLERAMQEIGPADFREPVYRRIFEALLAVEGQRDRDGEWLQALPADLQPTLEDLRARLQIVQIAPGDAFHASVRAMQSRPYEQRLRELDGEMSVAPPEQRQALLDEMARLIQERRERGLARTPYG